MCVRRICMIIAGVLLLAACSEPAPQTSDAAAPSDAPANAPESAAPAAVEMPADDAPPPAPVPEPNPELAALIAGADLNKGKVLFLQCRACHSLVPEADPGKIGPTLYGVLGRTAGSVAGFTYSPAVAKSGIVWTPEQIDHWLQRPSEFLPGNKMVFVGIPNPADRANIIAFVQAESQKPVPATP